MNIIDIILIVLLLYFVYKAYKDGFILSVVNVVILILSLFLSVLYVNEFQSLLATFLVFVPEETLKVIAYVFLFLGLMIGLGFLAKLLKIFNKVPIIGNLNQILGAFFGLIKGVIIISLLLFLMKFLLPSSFYEPYKADSKMYAIFESIAPSVYDGMISLIPIGESFYKEFNSTVKEELDQQIKKNIIE